MPCVQNYGIYWAPPYAGTTKYRGGFDHEAFWRVAREAAAARNVVLVSEYTAPDDVPCIAEFPKKLGLRTTTGGQEVRTERLFRLAPAHFPLDTLPRLA